MSKIKPEIKIHEEHYKGDASLVRAGIMFIQQSSIIRDPQIMTDLKSLARKFSATISNESTLAFYTTAELKQELRARGTRGYNNAKTERKKYG